VPLDAFHAACTYAWPWTACIAEFKFRGEAGRAAPLAALMHGIPGVRAALDTADLILPMPLAPKRLMERGFNQAHELARRLAPDKTDPALLLRTRDTPPQSGLSRAHRLRNLQGAFAIEPLRAPTVSGRRVMVVDDVMTSGVSLFTAARVLREAGATQVTAVVFARTEVPAS